MVPSIRQISIQIKNMRHYYIAREGHNLHLQTFSQRWNMALMAANDYIIVAPNRRGMPGWGVNGMLISVKIGVDSQ
jgi:hypothetical protein